jgi:predicted metalloprotease with PDZ domain
MAIHFILSASQPVTHFAEIEMHIRDINSEELTVELPSWRPGRYELGNFARNIRTWKVVNEKNQPLAYRKTGKDTWQIATEGAESLVIRYDYYSAQPDAGSCWVDEHQLYINPVHCLLYVKDRLHEPCTVELKIPARYRVATSLKKTGEHLLQAGDFHELYDSPFIASDSLQHNKYQVEGVDFNIWLQGSCEPDWKRILADFTAFSKEQFRVMKKFPFPEYHFLVQVLPYRFYHGVEHLKSTVLSIGPGADLMNEDLYTDFTGVASHELFHTWNVKTIRPVEMYPYDYKRENYSRLGYVYEGVTTYYGDLFLARCGVYSTEQFFKEIGVRLQKHFDNPGRHNLSVADSSFDTWLDGYAAGVPGRKTSIYDEGCLTALMTDLLIRRKTNSRASLDDVMRTLYTDFGRKNIGFADHDYIAVVENVAGQSMSDFFLDHIYGTEDDEALLTGLLSHVGCLLVRKPSPVYSERYFGFKTVQDGKTTLATGIVPGSPAFDGGLGNNDEVVAVNELKVEENLQSLLQLFSGKKIILTVLTPMKVLKDIALSPSALNYYPRYSIVKNMEADAESKAFFQGWLNRNFEEAPKPRKIEQPGK